MRNSFGIFPSGLKSMSVEALAYEPFPDLNLADSNETLFVDFLKEDFSVLILLLFSFLVI